MAHHDFGPVQVLTGPGRAEVRFPYDKSMAGKMKALGGQWSKGRRCWEFRDQGGDDMAGLVENVRTQLEKMAPRGWAKAARRLEAMTTVTSEYTLRVGLAGIRLDVPPGSSFETKLEKLEEAQRDGRDSTCFMIWASKCLKRHVLELAKAVSVKDRDLFDEKLFWITDRSVKGSIRAEDAFLVEAGVKAGGFVTAERSFVQAADPRYKPAPVREYALKVDSVSETASDGTRSLAYSYRDPGFAYKTLQARILAPEEAAPALDVSHVAGEFATTFDDGGVFDGY